VSSNIGVKKDLVENITQFLFDILGAPRLEGIDQLLDLFDQIRDK
jgi:hypothetical protein